MNDIILIKLKKYLIFSIIPLIALLLYYPVIFTYFSQDDFFHFKVSTTNGSISQFANLFGYHPFSERGIAFYRPVFREAFFNIFYSIFGLNPYPFRILQFVILFLNSFLVFYLINKIFREKYLAFFVAFFYSISSAQVAPLYYLAGGIQVLGATCFALLSLIYWEKYLSNQALKYMIFSLLAFIFALGSHEISVVTPFLLIGLSIAIQGFKKTFSHIRYFILLGLIITIHIYLEINFIGYSASEEQYHPVLYIKSILNSYMWYTGWALGLPEMLIDFVLPGFKLNPSLMRYWGNFYTIIFSAFFTSISLIVFSVSFLAIYNKGVLFSARTLFFLFWFFISLLPVIFLPLHKSTQYLELGLTAFWTLIGILIIHTYILLKKRIYFAKTYATIFCLCLFLLSASSIVLQRTTFWAAQRGKFAKQLIQQVTNTYPTLPKGATIYFENDPNYPFIANEWGSSTKQAALILNNEDALELVYHDPTLKVFYEDISKPVSKNDVKIYRVVAKLF